MVLTKFLANSGLCSRRKAEQLIKNGDVSINGEQVFLPFIRINEDLDKIIFQGSNVKPLVVDRKIYILFNKPQRLLCSINPEKGMKTIFDFFKTKGFSEKLISVGRLDYLSEGLILLTNDGDFANILAHPKHKIEKVYKVTLDKIISQEDIGNLRKGIRLIDGIVKFNKILLADSRTVLLYLSSGKNRIIRRVFERLRYSISSLSRIRQGNFILGDLKSGDFRYLKKDEVASVFEKN